MDYKKTIKQLTVEVLEQLKQQGYSKNSIQGYKSTYIGLLAYTAKNSNLEYSEAVGLSYMEARYGFRLEGFFGSLPKKASDSLHHLMILWHYQKYQTVEFITRRRKKEFSCPAQFEKEYGLFVSYCTQKKYTVCGLLTILDPVKKFLAFLDGRGVSFKDINSFHLSSFISLYIANSQRYVATIITSIRTFLKLLYKGGCLVHKAWEMLPKVKYIRNAFIPPSWKKQDIIKLLGAVDRGNPLGKRDYALLLLVVRLGLRASDIRNLRLKNIEWNRKKIAIIQVKTRQTLELPILDDVGWALIDYLKNGRPKTKSDTVFVNHKAPYGRFKETNGMQHILWKYMGFAGLEIPKNEHCGLHSLRSTLARTMLEHGASLPVISEVLGHESIQSTSYYLKINLEALRKCAIDPEEVFTSGS